jgi:hypothetical protein
MRALTAVALALGSSSILAFAAYGCSSSSGGVPTGPCQGPGCEDSGGQQDTGMQQDTGASDAGMKEDVVGDGSHDGAPPDALYGACEHMGSFGSACTASASGPDPANCTDPAYPDCFVGGQGSWCTKTCTSATDCTMGVEDSGCVPTSCNARGYCK